MGGLRKYMPITWVTSLIGSLALIGFPGFSGFFSKDAIIEAVHFSDIPGAGIAYVGVLAGVFITALYSFRMYFLVFHGKERMDEHTREHLHETPWVVTLPLVLLAIPSVIVGWLFVESALFGDHFGEAIVVAPDHNVLGHDMKAAFTSPAGMVVHGLMLPATWLALGGVVVAWFLYCKRPELPGQIADRVRVVYQILDAKYGFDRFNEVFFAGGARALGAGLWKVGDMLIIDGLVVNGSARAVGWISSKVRKIQRGLLYEYAFAMIFGLLVLLVWIVHG